MTKVFPLSLCNRTLMQSLDTYITQKSLIFSGFKTLISYMINKHSSFKKIFIVKQIVLLLFDRNLDYQNFLKYVKIRYVFSI